MSHATEELAYVVMRHTRHLLDERVWTGKAYGWQHINDKRFNKCIMPMKDAIKLRDSYRNVSTLKNWNVWAIPVE